MHNIEEISKITEENEHFWGDEANLSQIRRYHQLYDGVRSFFFFFFDAIRIEESPPNRRKKNALICLDLNGISIFRGALLKDLANIIELSDQFSISSLVNVTGKITRLCFGVENCWKERTT